MSEPLIAKWLDDRAGLTEDEALELQRLISADPELARSAKEQLATDELLSRRLAIDRRNFESQVAQRIATSRTDGSFTQSTLEAVFRAEGRRSPPRAWIPEAAAALLLVAGLMFVLIRKENAPTPASSRPNPLSGLRGEYFKDEHLQGPARSRIDEKVDFAWRKGAGPFEGWGDTFSVRWSGKIHPRYSERYTIRTDNDDGVRVWIDGKSVIDDWKGRPVVAENRGEVVLEAGKSYDLRVEYFNGGDIGVLRVYWSSASQKEEIVPGSQLSH